VSEQLLVLGYLVAELLGQCYSAKRLRDEDTQSLMYTRNSKGANTVPCGTPLVTLIGVN